MGDCPGFRAVTAIWQDTSQAILVELESGMNVYQSIYQFVGGMPRVENWPDIMRVLERAVHQEPRDWRLPLAACEAVGGSPDAILPALAALACAHLSLILIDDLLDADPRGEHHRLGMPLTANLATVFQQLAPEALNACSFANENSRLMAQHSLQEMLLTTALGQYLDFRNPADEVAYWHIVQTKSSPFFGSAFYVGALAAEAPLEVAWSLRDFGLLYGEIIQIHDDLSDSLATPASPDWTQGRWPLPMLFARTVDHPQRERFLALRQAIADPEALAEAQIILIRSGALSYGIHELMARHNKARTLLDALTIEKPEILGNLLEAQVKPVENLFKTLGLAQ